MNGIKKYLLLWLRAACAQNEQHMQTNDIQETMFRRGEFARNEAMIGGIQKTGVTYADHLNWKQQQSFYCS